jgi:protein-L-isoaspartate O-methyltransferase
VARGTRAANRLYDQKQYADALSRYEAASAAAPELPQTLYEQLELRGRLVVPVGRRGVQQLQVIVRSPEGPAVLRSVPCRFVPLLGEEGF